MRNILYSFILIVNIALSQGDIARSKRWLVYPDGGPARAQFIIGLGIPVDLEDQSVTVGTVIKFQYDLPTNSTQYTNQFYGFADTISRDLNDDKADEKTNNSIENDNQDDNEDGKALVDITFDRKKRELMYSEGGNIDNKQNKLSLEEAIRRQELIDEKAKIKSSKEEPIRANRWHFYNILEKMVERYGYSGRPCMLRTICEAAEVPFHYQSGLLAEIAHILLTPSTTKDTLTHHSDNEYHAAERLGADEDVNCENLFPECEASVLDMFSEIGVNTLRQFGLD